MCHHPLAGGDSPQPTGPWFPRPPREDTAGWRPEALHTLSWRLEKQQLAETSGGSGPLPVSGSDRTALNFPNSTMFVLLSLQTTKIRLRKVEVFSQGHKSLCMGQVSATIMFCNKPSS